MEAENRDLIRGRHIEDAATVSERGVFIAIGFEQNSAAVSSR